MFYLLLFGFITINRLSKYWGDFVENNLCFKNHAKCIPDNFVFIMVITIQSDYLLFNDNQYECD